MRNSKLLGIILAAVTVLLITACDNGTTDGNNDNTNYGDIVISGKQKSI
jgi:hypothetical protein